MGMNCHGPRSMRNSLELRFLEANQLRHRERPGIERARLEVEAVGFGVARQKLAMLGNLSEKLLGVTAAPLDRLSQSLPRCIVQGDDANLSLRAGMKIAKHELPESKTRNEQEQSAGNDCHPR